jgi:flavorubredoxin
LAIELFNQNGHVCLMFSHLSDEGGEAVQANQFLIVHNDHGCVIDPGGNMAFNELLLTIGRYFPPQKLDKILASHADPDIIASARPLDDQHHSAQLYIIHHCGSDSPRISVSRAKRTGRIVGIPDAGMRIPVGARPNWWRCRRTSCTAEGNFQFWDPVKAASCSRETWACR